MSRLSSYSGPTIDPAEVVQAYKSTRLKKVTGEYLCQDYPCGRITRACGLTSLALARNAMKWNTCNFEVDSEMLARMLNIPIPYAEGFIAGWDGTPEPLQGWEDELVEDFPAILSGYASGKAALAAMGATA